MCDLPNREEDNDEPLPMQVSDLIDELVVGITNARMFSGDHARVRSSLSQLKRGLSELGDPSKSTVEIGTTDGYLFHNGLPLLGVSLSAPRVLEPLEQLGSGGLLFDREASVEELATLVEFLAHTRLDQLQSYGEANQALEQSGCRGVSFLPPYANQRRPVEQVAPAKDLHPDEIWGTEIERQLVQLPTDLYQRVVDHLQETMVRVAHREELRVDEARGHVATILRRIDNDAQSLMQLCRYERYDTFTFGHSIRCCFLALDFARHLTDDEDFLHRVGLSALMHDIGKAWVPFEILHSSGELDEEARAEMARHAEYGGEIMLRLGCEDPLPIAVAFGHHTKESGERSYPRTVHQARASAALKVVKLCDVFEALTAIRPYKPAMSAQRAYRIMMSMKDTFDPALLRLFVQTNGLYPNGSRLELSTGESGVVVRQTDVLEAPVVQVERDQGGEAVPESDRWEIDLRAPDTMDVVTVTEVLTKPGALTPAA